MAGGWKKGCTRVWGALCENTAEAVGQGGGALPPVHFHIVSFEDQNFIFGKILFILLLLFKKALPNPRSQRFCFFVFFWKYYILSSKIYFELILGSGVRYRSRFILFLHTGVQLFHSRSIFRKDYPFPTFQHFLKIDQLDTCVS